MNHLNIIIPVITACVVSFLMYFISNDPKKNKSSIIFIRNILPGVVVGLLVFVLLRYHSLGSEQLMDGNYFD